MPHDAHYGCPFQSLGYIYTRTGLPSEAEEAFKLEIQQEPDNYKGYLDLAEYYSTIGTGKKEQHFIE